jgi:ABC-type sugar transport system ATPase subunit
MNKELVLQVIDLCKDYPGVKALDHMNFELEEGEIHGLLGLNGAGKSTFLNVINGLTPKTSGRILLYQKEISRYNRYIAQEMLIAIANQIPAIFPSLSVVDNILIGRENVKKIAFISVLDRKSMTKRVEEMLKICNFSISPLTKLKDLPASILKQIEIARALIADPKILCLDEPTSMMAQSDSDKLFDLIRFLKKSNKAIIYVTHRIPEMFKLCDRVTVMKDGQSKGTFKVSEVSQDQLVALVTGKASINLKSKSPQKTFNKEIHEIFNRETVLQLEDVSTKPQNLSDTPLENINFKAYKGEILGITGVVGAGKTELAKSIMGLNSIASGKIKALSMNVKFGATVNLLRKGIAYLPEDTMKEGLILNMNIRQNISLLALNNLSKSIFIKSKNEKELADHLIANLQIKPPNTEFPVLKLSGGNKKKVMIARGLAVKPRLFILDELTTGVDVESGLEILEQVKELAKSGITFILLSSEFERVLHILDRVLVMRKGKIVGELCGSEISEESVTKFATS